MPPGVQTEPDRDAAGQGGPACHVLVLDDQDRFLAFAAQELARVGVPLHVTLARTSDEAQQNLDPRRPADVALVDVELGGEIGLDVARSLMESGAVRRAILMSQHDIPAYRHLATADDLGFLPKKEFAAARLSVILGLRDRRSDDGLRDPRGSEEEP